LELDILYGRAKSRLWDKMERLRGVPDLHVSDFGTRRRHSFLWQEYVVTAMRDTLGEGFRGTSNTFLAYKHDVEAIGTNAHELPMALAAMARNDAELQSSQYRLLDLWQQTYGGELLILLPDTFGTTQFLRHAPNWVADWTGQRADSKDPFVAGEEYIAWLEERGRDPRRKLFIASDSLDVDEILQLHACFAGQIRGGVAREEFRRAEDFLDSSKWTPERRIRFSAGWGTMLTNDFRDCNPQGGKGFDPPRLVCKLNDAEGRSAVKLSDNLAKALGPPSEIERYKRVFGTEGIAEKPVGDRWGWARPLTAMPSTTSAEWGAVPGSAMVSGEGCAGCCGVLNFCSAEGTAAIVITDAGALPARVRVRFALGIGGPFVPCSNLPPAEGCTPEYACNPNWRPSWGELVTAVRAV
jgi:nicotinate phosphoribosyltransferase